MGGLVDERMALGRRLASAEVGKDCDALPALIEAADRAIDRLVYDLYGLSDEEVHRVDAAEADSRTAFPGRQAQS